MKKNGNKGSNGIHQMTEHHKLPRTRGGGNGENVVKIPRWFHEAWHDTFGNLTPEEVREFILIVFVSGKKRSWTTEALYDLHLHIQQKTSKEVKKKK